VHNGLSTKADRLLTIVQATTQRVALDEYLDEFQDLITEAGYSDPKTIVVKFHRGLDTQIQNAIATMPSGRPSDMVPTDWYTAARTIDQN